MTFQFPKDEITDEDAALDWWEQTFAVSCAELGVQADAAALVRSVVSSLREIRQASLERTLSLREAAQETGYSPKQVGRWLKSGQIENAGSIVAPRVHWQKFIRDRRSGALRPLRYDAGDKKEPIRKIGDRQIRYDLKFLMAVLNFATMARDDRDVPLLTHNPLKGLPYPSGDNPHRPMLTPDRYKKMREVAPKVHPLCDTFFVLAHETGHRAASVRQLRWSDINLEGGLIRWRAENDKIGFQHTTPLSQTAIEALERLQKAQGAIGDCWVFPSVTFPEKPLARETATKWWLDAERLAGLEHVHGMGFHSARRKFASELKSTNLRDLAYLGGWKNPQTVLLVYQQPEIAVQREALASRKDLRVG